MDWVWRTLTRTDQGAILYLAKVLPLVVIPGLIIARLFFLLIPLLGGSLPDQSAISGALDPDQGWGVYSLSLLTYIVIAPIVETLIMAMVFWGLGRLGAGQRGLILGQVFFWVGLHSLAIAGWGLTVAWAFFIFSVCFLAWRSKGLGAAIGVTSALHAGNNTVAILLPFLLGAME